ncbi:MAG TPA: ATP-dependent RecD-like DNA helicase [Aggregatilineales bacterium]|nr:ATP-dependent RecD-like DNA helicase [Aggregatilineales bacterium]
MDHYSDMQQEILEGVVEGTLFYNEQNGYIVFVIRPKDRAKAVRDGTVGVVGSSTTELQKGQAVRLSGGWTTHSTYGKQFKASIIDLVAPSTVDGVRRYLASGSVKGIGTRTAEKIVEHFGAKAIEILDADPERIREIPGVSEKLAAKIARSWGEQTQAKQAIVFLQSYNVGSADAVRIHKFYGEKTVEVVQTNPYRLAYEVEGIGFKKADAIARALGLAMDSPDRVDAGIVYVLDELNKGNGFVYTPRPILIRQAAALLGVGEALCEESIERLALKHRVYVETIPDPEIDPDEAEAVYLRSMYNSERGVAARMRKMTREKKSRLVKGSTLIWDNFFKKLKDITLTNQQQEAVRAALTNKTSVLTGGPGTGKTTTLRTVIEALDQLHATYALASPTGRAAKRLSEATGRPASTIHRLLGYSVEGFLFNEDQPLDLDMVIIDEASMIDLSLFYSVMKAVPSDAHLMLVGDVDQLPSVGAGDVLRDVIRGGLAHVTRLDVIFRQSSGSLIIYNAHEINQGRFPELDNGGEDFFMFEKRDPAAVADELVDLVVNRIPKKFGLHPLNDIQVLSPMKDGPVGVKALNDRLQAELNPPGDVAEKTLDGRIFRVGDKVIQLRNDYDKEVYNGDIGRLHAIDFAEQTMLVVMDGRFIEYDWNSAPDLAHAYAITIHRSQGSEYPAVVVPVVTQHYRMLVRNLLYTAITRAKRLVTLVGSRQAVGIAVENDQAARRYSALAWRLGQSTPKRSRTTDDEER